MIKDEINNKEEYGEVAELLGRLKHVEAPPDFDFRVKARIASGKPSAVGTIGIPAAARYAALLAVLLVVGGTAGYYVLDIGKSPVEVAPVDVPFQTQPPVDSGPANADIALVDPQAGNRSPDANGVVSVPRGERDGGIDRPQANSAETGTGSFDQAANVGPRILPPGINPNGIRPVRPGEFPTGSRISVKDVLSMLGVTIRAEGSAWTVESVNQISNSARAGLRTGDVIDSINDQKITISSSLKNPFTARSMRVIRNGAPVSIELTNP